MTKTENRECANYTHTRLTELESEGIGENDFLAALSVVQGHYPEPEKDFGIRDEVAVYKIVVDEAVKVAKATKRSNQ